MRWFARKSDQRSQQGADESHVDACARVRSEFSSYLDGAISGVEMAVISEHLQHCSECAKDFKVWRDVQRSLGELGPEQPPARLQARLRAAIAAERERGAHLPLPERAMLLWRRSVAPLALRLSGGLAVTVVLAGGLSWIFGAPVTVQANDDAMTHMVAPRYIYSEVPPEPIETKRDVPIVVDAMVDANGRVYRYTILEGPTDAGVQVRVENNLLSSVFQPATLFGVPVRGHVVLTYTGVSVRG
ncbi:MAG: zf-HC2 domain-containing protein [Acidobacteriaceae bacterium]